MAYEESQTNNNFFRNLDFGPTHQAVPSNFFDSIDNNTINSITIDTNSVNHLLDTTLDTIETAGDNTNSSSSVNPMSMDGTLHLRYTPTDTEDYAGDDKEDDKDGNRKPKRTPSSLVDSLYDKTMAEEESSVIQTFGAKATENDTTSSREILDVWSVQEVHETDNDGPPIIEINHAPIGVGRILKAVAANALASLSNKPQLIRNQATTFLEFISWPLYPFSSSYKVSYAFYPHPSLQLKLNPSSYMG